MKTSKNTTVAHITAARNAAHTVALQLANERRRSDEERQVLIDNAKETGVGIVHIFARDLPLGGLTVAFRKVSPYKSGRMVTVAVASCSPEDTFSKKTGTHLALANFFNGATIDLPLLVGYEEEDINRAVKSAFTALYGI